MSIKHVDYLNRSILFIDLEGAASDFEIIDLGEKAKKLVKLGSRTELLVVYNLTGMAFTRQLMQHLKSLMAYAPLVARRVIFGVDPRYAQLLHQILASLKLSTSTRYARDYVSALNLIVNDEEWKERRQADTAAWAGPERRLDPAKAPGEQEILDKLNGLHGS